MHEAGITHLRAGARGRVRSRGVRSFTTVTLSPIDDAGTRVARGRAPV
jgi:hypothetical protein